MTTAFLVRQCVLADGADEVAALVFEHSRENAAAGVGALLEADDVLTATIFLERGDDGPALWWYIEVSGKANGICPNPGELVQESPLYEAGIGELVQSASQSRIFGPDRPSSLLIIHARHPARPSGYQIKSGEMVEPEGEWKPRIVLAADGPAPAPDVVFVRWKLRSGPATWFIRGFARFANWLDEDSWLERKFVEWSEPVLEEEAMWTETGFLERGAPSGDARPGRRTRTALLGVMETAEMKGVEEGFYRTDNLVARVSERFLGWIVENPAQALRYEALRTDFVPLVHAVNPDRV